MLGSDAVGIVREVGAGVVGLAVGDRVCPSFHSAWIVASFGTPSLVELPDPVAGPGEILLDVRSVALNFRDHLMMRGLRATACAVYREAGDASDHLPVVATFEVTPTPG